MDLLKDNVKKIYLKYFFPTMGAALSTSIYILFDTIFIGQGVGGDGLTALNIALPIYSVYFGVGLLVGIGGSTLAAIEIGRKRQDNVNKIFTLSLLTGIIISLIFMIIGFIFLEEIAVMLGASKDSLQLVLEYMEVVIIGTVPFVMGSILLAFVRVDKSPKKAMFAVIFSGFLNIILDYIFVFPLQMGMAGAAIATVFSYTVSFCISLSHFFTKKTSLKFVKDFWNKSYIIRIFKCGLPSLFIEVSLGFVIFIFNIQILKILGEDGVTAYSIISNTAIIAVALFNGISQTIQPLISVNIGANLKERAFEIRKLGILTAIFIGTLFTILCLSIPEIIVKIFVNPTDTVLAIAINSIRLYSSAFIFMGINMVLGAYLQSIECSKESFIIAFCRGFLFVSIYVMVLPSILNINGVWLSVPLGEISTFFIAILILKRLNNNSKYA